MHKEVLLTERFPSIVFVPERLEGKIAASGTSEIELIGTVSLAGSPHPLTLPATVEIDGGRLSAETTFTVPYVEWGLEDPSILFLRVAKEVQVTIAASGSLQTPAAMASADER
jgi:polyisoprenoid-binding protein YceI